MMTLTKYSLLTFSLAATASAAIIQPVSVTGPAGDAGSSLDDLRSGSGLSTSLPNGTDLATAQSTTHTLTGTGHTVSWTLAGNTVQPVFSFDLGSQQTVGTALLWQYGNNGGPGQYDSGNHTREFELIFHTAAEGGIFDFTTEAVEFSGTMDYVDAGGPDSTATNLGQTFQFAPQDAQFVGLRIVSNYGGESVDGNTVGGGDRFGLGEVRFATEAIPEPSSTALIGLAGLGFILRRRR